MSLVVMQFHSWRNDQPWTANHLLFH